MNHDQAVWLVLVASLVLANLPYFSQRLLWVGPYRRHKSVAWRLLELVVGAGLTLTIGFGLEDALGQRSPQRWEFYAAAACLYITLGFPGFVWRYLRRRRPD